MYAVCPTDPSHVEFSTTAHVMEDWAVSPTGDCLRVIEQLETSFEPDSGNIWTCLACDAEAVVVGNAHSYADAVAQAPELARRS